MRLESKSRDCQQNSKTVVQCCFLDLRKSTFVYICEIDKIKKLQVLYHLILHYNTTNHITVLFHFHWFEYAETEKKVLSE